MLALRAEPNSAVFFYEKSFIIKLRQNLFCLRARERAFFHYFIKMNSEILDFLHIFFPKPCERELKKFFFSSLIPQKRVFPFAAGIRPNALDILTFIAVFRQRCGNPARAQIPTPQRICELPNLRSRIIVIILARYFISDFAQYTRNNVPNRPPARMPYMNGPSGIRRDNLDGSLSEPLRFFGRDRFFDTSHNKRRRQIEIQKTGRGNFNRIKHIWAFLFHAACEFFRNRKRSAMLFFV